MQEDLEQYITSEWEIKGAYFSLKKWNQITVIIEVFNRKKIWVEGIQ